MNKIILTSLFLGLLFGSVFYFVQAEKEVIKFLKDYSGSVDLENLIAFPIVEAKQ